MRGVFTIPHFNGYPAVLIALDAVSRQDLRDLLVGAWLAYAPAALVSRYLGDAAGTVD